MAIVIVANVIMGFVFFLSSLLVLFAIGGYHPPVIVMGVDVFSIQLAFAPSSSPVPQIAWSLPNYPFYVFLFSLVVNVFFVIKLQRSKEKTDTRPQSLEQTKLQTFSQIGVGIVCSTWNWIDFSELPISFSGTVISRLLYSLL